MVEELPEYCHNGLVSRENPLIIALVENSLTMEAFNKIAITILGRMTRLANRTCFEFRDISAGLLTQSITPNFTLTSADVFFGVLDTSAYGSFDHYVNSAWMGTADSLIVSKVPDKYETNYSTIVDLEDPIKALLLISVIVVSVFTSLLRMKLVRRREAASLTTFGRTFFGSLWNVSGLLVRQASIDLARRVSIRAVIGSWLLSSVVVGIYVSAFLKSDLSTNEYKTLDTLSDLVFKSDTIPVLIKHMTEHTILLKKAQFDEVSAELVERMESGSESFVDFETLISNEDFFENIHDGGKALIVNHLLWKGVFEFVHDLGDERLFYYGQSAISSGVMTSFYNRSLSGSEQEAINKLILYFVESKIIHQFLFRNTFLMEKYTWRLDLDGEVAPTTLKDLRIIFLTSFAFQMALFVILVWENILYDPLSRYTNNKLINSG